MMNLYSFVFIKPVCIKRHHINLSLYSPLVPQLFHCSSYSFDAKTSNYTLQAWVYFHLKSVLCLTSLRSGFNKRWWAHSKTRWISAIKFPFQLKS